MTAADGQIERQATGDSWALPPAPPATKTLRRLLRDAKPYLLIIALVVASASVFSAGRMTRAWLFTAGSLAAFGLIMATTYKPVKTLARGWATLAESISAAERFFQILDTPSEVDDDAEAVHIDGLRQELTFRNVAFSYGRESALESFSLEVKAGEVIAIVGPTGAGKTTIVDLLMRFCDPTGGSIELDGVEIRYISRSSLLDIVAVVTQDALLFDTSIAENIGYGRPSAMREEIMSAARTAHVDEFVNDLPQGYDTQVGEFGLKLSGGQRQRITIARAILKRASILLFDEATSALDARTEHSVQSAIDQPRGERTVFLIAHRLSTIRRADRIVVPEDGRVSQVGPHEELLARPGLYRDLVRLQRRET